MDTKTSKPAGRPHTSGFTHTGYLANDSESFTYAVALTEYVRFWQDSKGYRYSKRTGKPIGVQPFPCIAGGVTLSQIERAV